MTVLCANPTCLPRGADHAAPAADGLLLCSHHLHKLGTDAARLAHLHDELGQHLAGSSSDAVGMVRTHPGLSLDVAAAAARLDIRRLLVGTVRTIAHRRGQHLPCGWTLRPLAPGVHGPLARVPALDETNPSLAAYVAANATWLAGHPDAGTISDQYAYLRRRANGILYAEHTITVHIGPCPMLIAGQPCRGVVRALVRRSDELLPLTVTCEDPEHAWPVAELARLGRWIGIKEGRWMSATELAILYGLSMRRIHQLASIHRWERTQDGHRPVLYSALDARRTPTLVAIIETRTASVAV